MEVDRMDRHQYQHFPRDSCQYGYPRKAMLHK